MNCLISNLAWVITSRGSPLPSLTELWLWSCQRWHPHVVVEYRGCVSLFFHFFVTTRTAHIREPISTHDSSNDAIQRKEASQQVFFGILTTFLGSFPTEVTTRVTRVWMDWLVGNHTWNSWLSVRTTPRWSRLLSGLWARSPLRSRSATPRCAHRSVPTHPIFGLLRLALRSPFAQLRWFQLKCTINNMSLLNFENIHAVRIAIFHSL